MFNEQPVNAPEASADKPYRVTYYNYEIGPSYWAGDFKYYWQANLLSWFRHVFLGQGCNTWKCKPKEGEK